MSKKKLFFVVLLIVLVGFVLYLFNAFNGNPISKYISKVVLEDYLEEEYPDQEFRINEGSYNFKFSEYQYTVNEIGSTDTDGNVKEYEFNVRGFFNPTVSWDGVYYENLDQQLADRLSQQAEEEILPLLSSEIDTIHLVDIHIEVLKGKFADDIKWSKELALEKPIEVFVQLNSSDQSKEDFLSVAEKVKRILDEQGYEYEYVLFNGSGFDMEGFEEDNGGYLKYSLLVEKDGVVALGDVEEHNEDMQ